MNNLSSLGVKTPPYPETTLEALRKIAGFKPAILIFTAIMFAMIVSQVITRELPINVYNTYAAAAQKLANHMYPYPREAVEFHAGYKYSTLFGVLFYPIQALPFELGRFLWILINFSVFMLGLGTFLVHVFKNKNHTLAALLDKPYKLAILLILIFNEMSVSIKIGQANSLICGMMLLGLAFYAQGRNFSAGIILALASNFKIFPLALALLLLWDFRQAYWKSFLLGYIAALLLPALVLGWSWNMEMLMAWHKTLFLDFNTESKLSLMTFLEANFNFNGSLVYRGFVVLNILLLCVGYRFSFSASRSGGLRFLYPLTALFILLFNHRSEIELFVLVSPVYALMFLAILEKINEGRNATQEITFLAIGYFLITHLRTDLMPSVVGALLFHDKSQVLGSLILYLYFARQAWKKPVASESAQEQR
ncbi:MAG: hypothetical protein A3K09_06390 [Nitrospinae bacterium RIFCSPLOWO2_12_FULL_47_7]|nr:MAG: hypothetical protein A3K09_06390 [Nitrospinae bacterium RIFCSPLOWO2_12_FULL_47_7]